MFNHDRTMIYTKVYTLAGHKQPPVSLTETSQSKNKNYLLALLSRRTCNILIISQKKLFIQG